MADVKPVSDGIGDDGTGRVSRKETRAPETDEVKKFFPYLTPVHPPEYVINYRREKSPWPTYIGFDGIYKIDCVWVQRFDYFVDWENNKLNPYGIDGEYFMDTVQLSLFDDSTSWHSPLDRTIITSDFGLRRASWHYGSDFRLNYKTPVYAAFDGIVRITGYQRRGFGRFLVIRHANGLETVYAHLSRQMVTLGEEVKAGDVIGYGGSSGRSTAPHLHFEIRYAGNAIDPNRIFDFSKNMIRGKAFTVDAGVFAYLQEANRIRYHVVRSGDTLSEISYWYGVPMYKICRLNGIRTSSILRIGQRIRVN